MREEWGVWGTGRGRAGVGSEVWGVGCGVPGVERLVREVWRRLWGAYCMMWSVGNRMLRMGCDVPVAGNWAMTVRCGVLHVGCGESGEGLQMWIVWCGVWV